MDVTRIVLHPEVIRGLASHPAVTVAVLRLARTIQGRARSRVRVVTGRAQRGIVVRPGRDSRGFYADVVSTARGNNGYPYAAKLERRRPYLRPSIPGRL